MQDRIKEIRDRLEKATQGEWDLETEDCGIRVIRMGTAIANRGKYETQHIINYEHELYPEDGEQFKEAEANAALIANASLDIKYLFDALQEAQDSNKKLNELYGETFSGAVEWREMLDNSQSREHELHDIMDYKDKRLEELEAALQEANSKISSLNTLLQYEKIANDDLQDREQVLREALENIEIVADKTSCIYFEEGIREIGNIARKALEEEK
jgi:hypothetical protein